MFIHDDIHEKIIRLLVERGHVTSQEIIDEFHTNGTAARAQVYRCLKSLVAKNSIIKIGHGKYAISLYWLSQIESFIQVAKESVNKASTLEQELPSKGHALKKQFTTFQATLNYWNHCLALMLHNEEDGDLYSWIPHPWYALLPQRTLSSFFLSQDEPQCKIFSIIGGKSFLDKWNKQEGKDRVALSYRKSPFADKNKLYFDIKGNYIVTIRLSAKTAGELEDLYATVRSLSQSNYQFIQDFFQKKIKATVTFENNPRRSTKLMSEMKKHWRHI